MSLNGFLNRTIDDYKFHPDQSIPDLNGKVVIVTGGNVGLGYQSVLQIAQHNPRKIYLTARSKAKYDIAVTELRQKIPNVDNIVHFIEMDLASLPSVKVAADNILGDTDRIDILMNNAGIMGAPPALTAQGYEIHFGTNHMGHALFTKILMPLLLKTASANPSSSVRIVNVSSSAFQMADSKTGFDEKLVKTDMKGFSGTAGNLMSRYGASKLANVLHARGLAKHYPSITSVAIHPGRVKTGILDGMYEHGQNKFYGYFQTFYDTAIGAKTPYEGAYCQVWAATEPVKERLENGGMYNPVGKKDPGTKFSNNDTVVDRLWDFTEAELKAHGY